MKFCGAFGVDILYINLIIQYLDIFAFETINVISANKGKCDAQFAIRFRVNFKFNSIEFCYVLWKRIPRKNLYSMSVWSVKVKQSAWIWTRWIDNEPKINSKIFATESTHNCVYKRKIYSRKKNNVEWSNNVDSKQQEIWSRSYIRVF